MKEEYYKVTVEDTIKQFDTDRKSGLSTQTADNRFEENGPNEIQQGEKTSPWKLLWNLYKV